MRLPQSLRSFAMTSIKDDGREQTTPSFVMPDLIGHPVEATTDPDDNPALSRVQLLESLVSRFRGNDSASP